MQIKMPNTAQEIENAVTKLEFRLTDAEKFNIEDSFYSNRDGERLLLKRVRDTMGEIFGEGSPEYAAHTALSLTPTVNLLELSDAEGVAAKERGRAQLVAALQKLIAELKKKKAA
ncbi:MAG: hypothetical protein ISP90_06185 [Nevskia sp.]|nr:hypothetical protein [Nevskia sp.]